MRIRDLHELPKLRDGLSYLYLEHCIINQKYKAIEAIDKDNGRTMLPVAALAVLMLGPGTSISHEAVKTLCDNGCSLLWCGEEGVRLYAQGVGETARATGSSARQSWSAIQPSACRSSRACTATASTRNWNRISAWSRCAATKVCGCARPTHRPANNTVCPGVADATTEATGVAPTHQPGAVGCQRLPSTASAMPPSCRQATRRGWASSTLASSSPSSTMSPICTRPRSPCRWPSA